MVYHRRPLYKSSLLFTEKNMLSFKLRGDSKYNTFLEMHYISLYTYFTFSTYQLTKVSSFLFVYATRINSGSIEILIIDIANLMHVRNQKTPLVMVSMLDCFFEFFIDAFFSQMINQHN